ncbi:MAG: complex I NDUFA9 subunit family protein, partial [Caldimonas sp.]
DRAHVELPRRRAEACAAAGVKRVVHVRALGADARAPSRYLRTKAAGEAALAGKGLEVTLLRPSVIFGEGDHFLNLFAALQAMFPVVPLAGAGARFQPVWVDDVAAAIARCLEDRTTIGETIECCGPTVYTLRDLVRLAGHCAGHPRPVVGLPAPLGRLQATLMEWLPGEPLMSRDNLDSMRVASVASGQLPGLTRLGIRPAAIEAIAPTYLGRAQGPARLDAWRAAVHGR